MTAIEGNLVIGLTQNQQDDQVLPQSGTLVAYSFDGAELSRLYTINTSGAIFGLTSFKNCIVAGINSKLVAFT